MNRSRSAKTNPNQRAEEYIKDWNWDEASHEFALQMGVFLLEFMDSLHSSGLLLNTIRKHESNCWLIGSFECDYGYHKAFTPAIFWGGPIFLHEFKRKVSDSKYAIASYESTWRRLERYIRELDISVTENVAPADGRGNKVVKINLS